MSTTRLTTLDMKRKQREQRFRKQREQLEKRQAQEEEKQKQFVQNMKSLVQQIPLAVVERKDRKQRAIHQMNENLRRIKELVRLYERQKNLIPAEKEQLLKLGEYIVSKQEEKDLFLKDIIHGALRDLRIHDFPVKFSSDYYHFLKKKMFPLDSVETIIKSYSRHSQQGTAFEALWTMLLTLGFCQQFPSDEFDFYNAELKEPSTSTQYYFIERVMTTSEYLQFLRETPIRGPNGKSDITLRNRRTGEWIFISCKYYQHEKGDYDISAIQRTIQETNRHHPRLIQKHKIYVFANNKEKATIPIENKFKDDPIMKEIISTDGVYNILGMDDLNDCFETFKEEKNSMTWTDFEKKYLKQYRKKEDQKLPSLVLRVDQDLLVKRTYGIIYKNISKNQCSTRSTSGSEHLKIVWNTIPQFGKTYCVGRLIQKLLKIPPMFRTSPRLYSVIVVDNLEIAHKYANEVLGAHEDFVDHFHVTIVKNRSKPINLVDYLRLTPKEKVVHTLQKYKDTNNILIVLKEDLELVRDLKNLFLIVFDVDLFEHAKRDFDEFTNSPHRIGLFMSAQPQRPSDCEYVLTWSDQDSKSIQKIYRQSIQKPQQSIGDLLQTTSFLQRRRDMFQQQSNHRSLVRASRQDLEKCLRSPVYIVSDFVSSSSSSSPSMEKIQKAMKVIRLKKQENPSFSTQFWFVNDRQACFQWKEQLKQLDADIDVAIYGENQGSNRNPTPYKDLPGLLTAHNQKLASTIGKDTFIYLIPVDKARMLRGVSFPNVDTVFYLSDRVEKDDKLFAYALMAKCKTPKEGKTSMYFVDFHVDRVKKLIETCLRESAVAGLIDVDHPDRTTEQILVRTPVGKIVQQMIRKIQQEPKQKSKQVLQQIIRKIQEQEQREKEKPRDILEDVLPQQRIKPPSTSVSLSASSRKHQMKKEIYDHFKKKLVVGDGNCLLSAVSESIGHTPDQIRRSVVDYIRQHPEFLSQKDRQMVQQAKKSGHYESGVADLFPSAIANVYRKNLMIYDMDRGTKTPILGNEADENFISLEYVNSQAKQGRKAHYNLFIPLTKDQRELRETAFRKRHAIKTDEDIQKLYVLQYGSTDNLPIKKTSGKINIKKAKENLYIPTKPSSKKSV